MNEPPEDAIMLEKPRDVKRSRLVDINLIGYAYLFYGNLISVGAQAYTHSSYLRSNCVHARTLD